MKSIEFGHIIYIVTLDFPNCGGVTCYGCETMDEVFQVFTDDLKQLANWVQENDPDALERFNEDSDVIMQLVNDSVLIKNPSIINYLYNQLYDDIFGMNFYVIEVDSGKIVFRYEYIES